MKAVKIDLAGRTRYLAFTVEAMFQIQETFGGSGELIEAIKDNTREGFNAACKAAAILAEQGELVRRGLGYDPEPITDAETIAATMAPSEIAALKVAIPSALTLGYGREIESDDGEVDLGLAELNTQKKRGNTRPLYPYGNGKRAHKKGGPPIHPRGDRGPLGAIPPSPQPQEKAGAGGRIKPEGRGPSGAGSNAEQLLFLCLKLRRSNGPAVEEPFIFQDFVGGRDGIGSGLGKFAFDIVGHLL